MEIKHNHHHNHYHHHIENNSQKDLFLSIILNLVITLTEIIGGIYSGSLALLSDSFHNLTDTLSIILSYFALKFSQKPKNKRLTFGYKRVQILAAFINSSALIIISFWLFYEAIVRLLHQTNINTNIMLPVSIIGLLANFFTMFLLKKHSHNNLNIKASYLHIISDTFSSVGVVIGAILIKFFNIVWIDPLITIIISFIIIKEAYHVLKTSTHIILQGAPLLNYEQIDNDLKQINGITNIHHIHSWYLDDNTIHFEAHIELDNNITLEELDRLYDQINNILKTKYNITHTTIQPEYNRCSKKELF